MPNRQKPESETKESGANSNQIQPPAISLPKGGGAIRGIGEKFAANPVTGTGSMTVPIATSPGRSGFGPQLSLSYDSGSGNGPFGFGWSLSLPSITRKTDKGLPQYRDAEQSDEFILSGAEDLVPEFEKDDDGNWVLKDGKHVIHDKERPVNGVTYNVRRYRPRIEGLFARIERWTNQADSKDCFWRSISKDNITTWYGKTQNSRIFDPAEPSHIFSWFICQSYDDKGNTIIYKYAEENSQRIFEDPDGQPIALAHERNRDDKSRSANRYLKRIYYGNREPYLPELTETEWPQPPEPDPAGTIPDFFFEVVFDYDDGHYSEDKPDSSGRIFARPVCTPQQDAKWPVRVDPFSTYRAGFEVRTYRLCQRVLMFHHFPDELGTADYLVRSTDFTYSYENNPTASRNPIYSFLDSVSQSGYVRQANGTYLKRSLPPLEFEYTQPVVRDQIEEVDAASLENVPNGLDGSTYQWTDLHGEGIPGILTEQAGAWFYKRNLSPISTHPVQFAPLERVAARPNLALSGGQAQFMDLAGDGQPDLVIMDGPMPGLYEHDENEGWQPFRSFISRLNRDTRDPNLKFVDLDGDGHADVLISEDNAFVWHPSLAEEGFGPVRRAAQVLDEEKGPRLVFADGTQSVYLADLSGDGLTDIVRIRNGEVCYWPNLGYGKFGAKVTMDNAPWFDAPDQFDQKRIRLADIDGSGTTDIIYLNRDGVRLYFNQSGNSWSAPQPLRAFPPINEISSITPIDLKGNGTACLVWSSPLPGDARRQMRYVDLMGEQKPHLLVKTVNNLGAETRVQYAPSTKFYLADKEKGRPWITRLPFPVHVVEKVETYDFISRNHFVTRYTYHHGYFDGEEREFRGFGMVEQWDTEQFTALTSDGTLPEPTNLDAASHVPPVLTRAWFHTGVYFEGGHISRHFEDEYFREPALSDQEFRGLLLPDTTLPTRLTFEEEREACRALKGSMLRQEVYALDGTPKEEHPYTVADQNFSIQHLQPRDQNRHAVFFTHAREVVTYHYERNPEDPRVQHGLTLEVDSFGNVLKQTAIGYGRRQSGPSLSLQADRDKQTKTLITYTENRVTNATVAADDFRTPLPCETRTYELTGFKPENSTTRFSFDEWTRNAFALLSSAIEIPYEQKADSSNRQKRLIEHVRILYRKNDLTALLPLGLVGPLALPGESYKLAFTPGLLAQVLTRDGQELVADPAGVLGGQGPDRGGYVDLDGNGHWWIPSGRVFYHSNANTADPSATSAQELSEARKHFYLLSKVADPFDHRTLVDYDDHDLLITRTSDALENAVTAANDYRVLQPRLVTDPNRNRAEVAFDTLGMALGTAVMGKTEENLGDSLDSFEADLTEAVILEHLAHPLADPHAILGRATTRLVYDLYAYHRTKNDTNPLPAVVYTLARETHDSALSPDEQTKIQQSFTYSDGFGREIQKKIQAGPGPVPKRNADGTIILAPDGHPEMTPDNIAPRWVGSGWTVFNNKGKPIRHYEPCFTETHNFEFDVRIGVSPVLFYDPVERVVATLHPNHTYEKVVFDPWQQTTYDVNDTIAASGAETGDPRTDLDIQGYVREYFMTQPDMWQTWYAQRQVGALGIQELTAANKAAAHANTPTTAYFDTLGRPFLTAVRNKVACPNHELDGMKGGFYTRVELDIEGNECTVRDPIEQAGDQGGRIVMRYDYDMLGNRVHQASMEAGERWMLNDVVGKPLYAWDSRNHAFRTEYDPLRRPTESFMREGAVAELMVGRSVYGESRPDPQAHNVRGKVVQVFDQAGVVTIDEYDFKGNLLGSNRKLAQEYKATLDWSAAVPLEADTFTGRTRYDALNRAIQLIAPHRDQPDATVNVIQPSYNEANLLTQVQVWLNQNTEPAGRLDPATATLHAVTNIDYDAKGQRTRIDYGTRDGTLISTSYAYDRDTFRLIHLYTRRGVDPLTRQGVAFIDDCDNPQSPPSTIAAPENPSQDLPCGLQNLHYTYDPAGNITYIRDDAQQTIYFKNKCVEPSAEYTYDAIYRLIEATGREHLGQIGGSPIPHSYSDAPRVGIEWSGNDAKAMGTYIERYVYDAVGNFLEMIHHGSDPANPGWTRTYTYNEASLLESGKKSNRLTGTTVGATTEAYSAGGNGYDAHGNMLRMPHLQVMQWDFKNQLQMTQRQAVNAADADGIQHQGERTYYVYDSAGQRARKVTERQATAEQTLTRMKEHIYLGGFEIYREYIPHDQTLKLERETLHIMDDKQRIALIETRTQGSDLAPERLIRYQFGNYLGSAGLELDDQAQIISYEEYTPYGGTSYQAVRSTTETPKRYRYTGKERDEETGLYYYGSRYYAPWLGRWTGADPAGLVDGVNLYEYAQDNPIRLVDRNGKLTLDEVVNSPEFTQKLNPEDQSEALRFVNRVKDLAAQNRLPQNESFYAEHLKILVNTEYEAANTPPGELSEVGQQRRAETKKEDIKAQNKTAGQPDYIRLKEEGRSYRSSAAGSFVQERGQGGVTYQVDRSNLSDINVKLNIYVDTEKLEDKAMIVQQEDAIEKFLGRTQGFSVDIKFLNSPPEPGRNDVFVVKENFNKWVDSGNLWGGPGTLAHETMHLLGLDDRYDYIANHAGNTSYTKAERLALFHMELDKFPDPMPAKPSLMGPALSGQEQTDKLLNYEVCQVASREDQGKYEQCKAARSGP